MTPPVVLDPSAFRPLKKHWKCGFFLTRPGRSFVWQFSKKNGNRKRFNGKKAPAKRAMCNWNTIRVNAGDELHSMPNGNGKVAAGVKISLDYLANQLSVRRNPDTSIAAAANVTASMRTPGQKRIKWFVFLQFIFPSLSFYKRFSLYLLLLENPWIANEIYRSSKSSTYVLSLTFEESVDNSRIDLVYWISGGK